MRPADARYAPMIAPARPAADLTADILLRWHREPSRGRSGMQRDGVPAVNPDVVVRLALGRHVPFVDPELDRPRVAAELREAAAQFVQQVFFHPDASPYQVLGVAPDASPETIKETYRLLMQLVHPDRQGEAAPWPETFAARVNRAYGTLRDPELRAAYRRDAEARAGRAAPPRRGEAAPAAAPIPAEGWRGRRAGGRPAATRSVLPEWLTAGVGGFVLRHPASSAFAALIVGSVLAVAAAVWPERDGVLMGEAGHPAPRIASPVASAPALPPTGVSPTVAGIRERDAGDSVATRVPLAAATAASEMPPPARVPVQAADSLSNRAAAATPGPAGGVAAPASAPPSTLAAAAPPVVASAAVPPAAPAGRPSGGDRALGGAGGTPFAGIGAGTPTTAPPAAVAAVAPPGAAGVAAEPTAVGTAPLAAAPANAEIEALFAAFVSAYEGGRLDAFVALFDEDAETNLRRGRAAVRGDYDELFRLSQSRRMHLTRVNWRRVGDRALAKGEIAVTVSWRDGREFEQRVAVDMELVRQGGRAVISRLSFQPR
jgi:hypothetical protein